MALRDSLRDGESYFIVEIKSLRRILQASGQASAKAAGQVSGQASTIAAGQVSGQASGQISGRDAVIAAGQISGRDAVIAAGQVSGQAAAESPQALQQVPVLCCIDEVLRGTNTVERIAASAEILRCFAGRNVLCFAATHDLELTSLLGDVFDNYHFSEEIEDGDVRFSYRLQPGPSTTCNAIALLGALGYDRTLVDSARARADRFLAGGRWQ